MKNNKHSDIPNLLHSPREAEVAPDQPCTDDRSRRVANAFPITRADEGSKDIEPVESVDLKDGCVNWKPPVDATRREQNEKRKPLRNRD